jgi:hypothetical protein
MEVLFRSPLGALLAKPWVDQAGLFGLKRWYFPLSRLWAAANAAGDDPARFRDEIGAPVAAWPEPYLRSVLARNAGRKAAAEMARAGWEASLFGDAAHEDCLLLDRRRRAAATRHWRRALRSIRCCFRHARRRRAGKSTSRITSSAISDGQSTGPTASTPLRSTSAPLPFRAPS